jgi:hypothetical protein
MEIVQTQEQKTLGVEISRKRRKHKTDEHATASARNKYFPFTTLHAAMDCNAPSCSSTESDTNSDLYLGQQTGEPRSSDGEPDSKSHIRSFQQVEPADHSHFYDHGGLPDKGKAQEEQHCEDEERVVRKKTEEENPKTRCERPSNA